jgi:hypothetical protein
MVCFVFAFCRATYSKKLRVIDSIISRFRESCNSNNKCGLVFPLALVVHCLPFIIARELSNLWAVTQIYVKIPLIFVVLSNFRLELD